MDKTDVRARPLRQAQGAVAAVLVLMLATLSGCTNAASATVTITFMQNKREVIGYFDDLIAEFEAQNPGIRVLQDNNEGGFVPSLVRNSPPDITTRGWNYASGDFTKRGVFTDLSGLEVAKSVSPDAQALVDEWGRSPGGGTPALPYSLTAAGVIYNQGLFEKHGVEVPTTWDEFVAACETFQAADVTPIYGTYKEAWSIQQGLFEYATGGLVDISDFYARLNAEGAGVPATSPATFGKTFAPATEAMGFIMDNTQENAPSRSYPDGNVAFANGESAMYFQGPWALSEIQKANPDASVGTFALPMTNDPADTKTRVNVDLAFSIPTGAAHPDEAREFLEFLFQPEIINAYNLDNAAFSTMVDAPAQTDDRIAGLNPYVEAGRYYQGAATYLPPSIPVTNYLQSFALNRDAAALYSALDAEWKRVAQRNAARGNE